MYIVSGKSDANPTRLSHRTMGSLRAIAISIYKLPLDVAGIARGGLSLFGGD